MNNRWNKSILLFFVLICSYSSNNQLIDQCLIEKKEEKSSIYEHLEINTLNEYSIENDEIPYAPIKLINILSECKLSNKWDTGNWSSFYEDYFRIFEDEEISFRTFRISLNKNKMNKKLSINNIELDKNTNNTTKIIAKNLPFDLTSQSSFDFFIEYFCSSKDYIDLSLKVVFNENLNIYFHYTKICSKNSKFLSNLTYLLLIFIFIILSYLCEKDLLILEVNLNKIKLEEIIHLKNAEHITIYSLIICSILILLGILTLFKPLAYFSGFIISLISIKFFLKSVVALFNRSFNEKVSSNFYIYNFNNEISISISFSKIIFYFLALIIFVLWIVFFDNNLLLNLISFSISYLVIKKFKFNNFYFIIFLFSITLMYNIVWIFMYSTSYKDFFNFTSGNFINIPIRFIIPEIKRSPYDLNYFFSILDLILVGFVMEYTKTVDSLNDSNYSYYSRYGLYFGLFINIFIFYVLKRLIPFFVFIGLSQLSAVIGFSIYLKEFRRFANVGSQDYFSKAINFKEYPLQIIGADKSQDYNEMVSYSKYIPPATINELEGVCEESPKDGYLQSKGHLSH